MSKKTFWSLLSLVFVFLAITVGSITQPLLACVMPPPDPPDHWVRFLTPTTIKIIVHNFTTFGSRPGQFCACGLTHLGVSIQSIDSVRVVLTGTDTVLESFSFEPNDNTTSGFNDNHESPNWQGFLSGVSARIEPGIPVDLQFFATIQEGTRFSQVASDLAGGWVGTDEGTEDGSLTGGHLNITEPGEIMQTACVEPPSGLVSWWPADGNTDDIIGGNNGTWMGTPTYAAGEVGSAFSFDGASYITMGTPSSLNLTGNQVTIDGWINPSVNNNDAIYFGKTAYGFNDYLLIFQFNQLTGMIKAGGTESIVAAVPTPFVPPVNQWTHIALTYDGASMKLYANGTLIGSLAKTGNIDGDGSEFAIGGRALDPPGRHLYFTGEIDEVDVFDRALTDSEIAAIYNAGTAGKCQDKDVHLVR